jgi:type IV pilus assembly protein PilA
MKLVEKLKKKKADNKGFSLVELIIVIAIMAILVGIVGTQVVPYLNRSREAKDQQILSAWVTAATSAYSANAGVATESAYTITVTDGDVTISPAVGTGKGSKELLNTFGELSNVVAGTGYDFDKAFASKTYQGITEVEIVVTTAPTGTTHTVELKITGGSTEATAIDTSLLVAD